MRGPTKVAANTGYTWATRSFPFLLAMYHEIYIEGKRIIPQYVYYNMSPSMLAFLVMQNANTYGSTV